MSPIGGSNRTPLERLFDDFVDVLREKVKGSVDDEGKRTPCSAADLNVIRQFLKEQNISADDDRHEGLKDLKSGVRKQMPFSEGPSEDDL